MFKQRQSKFTFIKLVIAVVLFNPGFIIGLQSTDTFGNLAYAAEKKTPKKTRRTPAMREKIYNQIARAQKFLDEGNKAESVEVIDRLKRRMKQLNSYEKAKVWQFEGFMHFNDNDLMAAVKSFEKVSGKKLNYKIVDRRQGDVIAAYAETTKANNVLGWKTELTLDDAMDSAWKWEQRIRNK